ncbi:MAG: lamin tail domain-containing protein [Elusimicrobiota bacterium]|nr:lamin tail domain-containing protein [Elusimicrobiota bacterium]
MKKIKFFVSCFLVFTVLTAKAVKNVSAVEEGDVVINEIAWTGTFAGYRHRWIELYNTTDEIIDMAGWIISDGENKHNFSGADLLWSTIAANGYYILEYEDGDGNTSIQNIVGGFKGLDQNFTGKERRIVTLSSGSIIVDEVDCTDVDDWYAGDADNEMSMEKILPAADSNDERWWGTYDPLLTAPYALDADGEDLYGTPGQQNSIYDTYTPAEEPSDILDISNTPFFPHEDHTPALARIAYKNTTDSTMYVTVTIYDVKGREVKHILRYEELASEEWEYYEWDGKDDYGDILPMGVYIVHMRLEPGDAGSVKEARDTVVLGRRF